MKTAEKPPHKRRVKFLDLGIEPKRTGISELVLWLHQRYSGANQMFVTVSHVTDDQDRTIAEFSLAPMPHLRSGRLTAQTQNRILRWIDINIDVIHDLWRAEPVMDSKGFQPFLNRIRPIHH